MAGAREGAFVSGAGLRSGLPGRRSRLCRYRSRRARVVEERRRGGVVAVEAPGTAAARGGGSGMKEAFGDLSEETKATAIIEAFCREGRVEDAIRAIEELEGRGVHTTSRARAVLMDCAVTSGNVNHVVNVASVLAPSLKKFGSVAVHFEPARGDLPPLPDPDRILEIVSALTFLAICTGGVSMEVFDGITHQPADGPTSFLAATFAALAADGLVLRRGVVRRIRTGMTRIFGDDPIRRCRVESASFLVAYLLGIPLLCYQPTVQAVRASLDTIDATTLDRYLVWAVAGAATEAQIDGRIIETDAEAPMHLMSALTLEIRRGAGIRSSADQKERIRWAFHEAQQILTVHRRMHAMLEKRMLAGASVGESMEMLEQVQLPTSSPSAPPQRRDEP